MSSRALRQAQDRLSEGSDGYIFKISRVACQSAQNDNDEAVLEAFRGRAESRGIGYQTLINQALRDYLTSGQDEPLTESALRRILREELTDQYNVSEADV